MEELLRIKKRLGRRSKTKFLNIVRRELISYGYECDIRTFPGLVRSVNLETREDQPDYLFIAHYDTFTIMPFWFDWLMRLVGINRQFLMILLMIILLVVAGMLPDIMDPLWGQIIYYLLLGSMLSLLIPTPVNYDDNTSGVIAVLKLARRCKEMGIDKVKFLFVDNEELGLIGSAAHVGHLNRNRLIPEHCRVISLDCVGGSGKIPLIIRNGRSGYEGEIREALRKTFGTCKSVRMLLPASDNFSFKRYGAVNISFVSPALIPGGYCIRHIHSPFDRKLDPVRLDRLADSLAAMIRANRSVR